MLTMNQLCRAGLLTISLAFALATPALAQKVRLSTTQGDIVIELEAQKAPKTVANFREYVAAKHYDGTIFHRVISNFMIQGGGFKPDMSQKNTRPPIALESRSGLTNLRGTVSMARTAAPGSATSQFFINVVDNNFLDAAYARDGNGYAVFGKVVLGMDVVDRIRLQAVGTSAGQENVPRQAILITTATLEK